MSFAVITAWTPGRVRAAPVSIDRMRPCATELRRMTACSSPGWVTVYGVIRGMDQSTPDVIVPDDTLLTVEQDFLRSLAPKAQAFVTVVNQYAFELKDGTPRTFSITPAWRTELRRRLGVAGITIDPKYEPAATRILDRELDRRVSRLVLGDAGARQRSVPEDHQLARAITLLSAARTQEALFAAGRAAGSLNAAVKPDLN